jgi:hypothetical protein
MQWAFVWLLSLFVATFLGFEKGRWLAGLLLGLLFGPLGAIGAGLMLPSVEYTADRNHLLRRQVAELERRDRLEMRKRRRAKAEMDALVSDIEGQVESEELFFADGLEELAYQIEQIDGQGGSDDKQLRNWVGWLQDKANVVRKSPRHAEERI